MKYVFMLIYFRFPYVTENLINLRANEGEQVNNLFTCQKKEKLEGSKKSKHMLEEPKDQLQIQCWKTWLKGLLKMRTLPKFTLWVFVGIL